jgi:hypothetical protein
VFGVQVVDAPIHSPALPLEHERIADVHEAALAHCLLGQPDCCRKIGAMIADDVNLGQASHLKHDAAIDPLLFSSVDDVVAAVDVERLTGDQLGCVRCKEGHGHADVVYRDQAAGGSLRLRLLQ